jgi:O-antigen ligase
MVGMMLGLMALAVSARFPTLVRRGLMGLAGLGFVACIPIAFALSHYGADHWDSLQFSFRHRIQIWNFTAERILHWPFFGLGLESSRNIPVGDLAPGFLSLAQDKPPLHPHNMFLQLWLELGSIGCAIAFAVIARILCAIQYLRNPSTAFTAAAATAVLAIASFAFGIWQGWWLALMALLAIFLLTAARDKDNA